MPPGVTEKSRTAAINDALVFRRAVTAAGAGLLIQLSLLVATGLTALWGTARHCMPRRGTCSAACQSGSSSC